MDAIISVACMLWQTSCLEAHSHSHVQDDDLEPMAAQDQEAFATAENVGSCSKFLLNSLAGEGKARKGTARLTQEPIEEILT